MTIRKPNQYHLNNKKSTISHSITTKAIKSRHSKIKPSVTTKVMLSLPFVGDDAIQSTDQKRRYMRRGSRAPSMMLMSQNEKDALTELAEQQQQISSTNEIVTMNIQHDEESYPKQQQQKQQPRRMSVMTSLKSNFEQVTILENTARQIRRMSFDATGVGCHHRRCSLEYVRIVYDY